MSDEKKKEPFDYTMTQERLTLLAEFSIDLQLKEMLEKISNHEVLTPLLNPSAYMAGSDSVNMVRDLAIAARDFQKAAIKFKKEFPETQRKGRQRMSEMGDIYSALGL